MLSIHNKIGENGVNSENGENSENGLGCWCVGCVPPVKIVKIVKIVEPYYGNFNRLVKCHFNSIFLVKKDSVVGRFQKKQIWIKISFQGKIIDTSSN